MNAIAVVDLKQRLARLTESERIAMSAYLLRLKHQSKRGRQSITKLMGEMDAGRKVSLSKLSADLANG